jgi:hypothetical protein
MHVCGSLDPWYGANTLEVEKRYRQLGGNMKVLTKAGAGHFDALPEDITPIIDFITANQH